jgi:hypothetical protein
MGSAAAPASHSVCLQFMWEVGLPSSPVELSSLCLSHKVAVVHTRLPPEALRPGPACLFTVPERIFFPQSLVLSAPHPLSHMSFLFLLLISQFLFFPQVGVGLSRGLGLC